MRLADFIEQRAEDILTEWDTFVATQLPAAARMNQAELRDHCAEILKAVSADLRTPQSRNEQLSKSRGLRPALPGAPETAAQTHALLRARSGFTIQQLVAEFRALRSSVLTLWGDTAVWDADAMHDAGRFNEAIDQAIAESVDFFSEEVNRWRALFLGVLGHDLRGPLNAIMLTSHLIARMSQGSLDEQAAVLVRSGNRMRDLLGDLLDFSRTSLHVGIPVTPTNIDLASVCSEEIKLLRAAFPAAVIEFSVQGDVTGCWDPSRIKQVLGNLVGNATRYGDTSQPIKVSLVGDDLAVRLAVANSGVLIPQSLIEVMWDPLRRGEAEPGGERENLGLGLFIVRQVALAHGGEVSVRSFDGQNVFTVTLPKLGCDEQPGAQSASVPSTEK